MVLQRRTLRTAAAVLVAGLSVAVACETRSAVAPPLARSVTVGGSGAAYPAVKVLTAAFASSDPGVVFAYRPSSSGPSGVRALAAGEIQVASLAQPLDSDEGDIVLVPVATDAVVVAVHPSVRLDAVTSEQVRGLYSGAITSWGDLGLSDAPPLQVIDRPEDETAKIALRRILGATLTISSSVITMPKETDMVRAVESTPGAVGFFSLSYLVQRPDLARGLRIDGVPASTTTIREGTYPVTRPIFIAVRRAERTASPVREFVEFVGTPLAVTALERNGYGPAR